MIATIVSRRSAALLALAACLATPALVSASPGDVVVGGPTVFADVPTFAAGDVSVSWSGSSAESHGAGQVTTLQPIVIPVLGIATVVLCDPAANEPPCSVPVIPSAGVTVGSLVVCANGLALCETILS